MHGSSFSFESCELQGFEISGLRIQVQDLPSVQVQDLPSMSFGLSPSFVNSDTVVCTRWAFKIRVGVQGQGERSGSGWVFRVRRSTRSAFRIRRCTLSAFRVRRGRFR